MKKNKISLALSLTGLAIIALGALLPLLLGPKDIYAKIVFSVGAGILLIGRLFTVYDGKVFRVKRLFAIEKWSAIFFCVAAFFQWYSDNPRDWLAFVLAGAFIQLYTSIAIPRARIKAQRRGEE